MKKERNRIPAHFLVVQLLLACVAHSVLIYNVSLAFLPVLMRVDAFGICDGAC